MPMVYCPHQKIMRVSVKLCVQHLRALSTLRGKSRLLVSKREASQKLESQPKGVILLCDMGWQLLYLTLIPSNLYLKIPHPTLMRNKFLLLSCCYICFEVNPSSMSKHGWGEGDLPALLLVGLTCWSSLLRVSNINTFVSLKSLFSHQHLQLNALLSHFHRIQRFLWPSLGSHPEQKLERSWHQTEVQLLVYRILFSTPIVFPVKVWCILDCIILHNLYNKQRRKNLLHCCCKILLLICMLRITILFYGCIILCNWPRAAGSDCLSHDSHIKIFYQSYNVHSLCWQIIFHLIDATIR